MKTKFISAVIGATFALLAGIFADMPDHYGLASACAFIAASLVLFGVFLA